MQNEIFSVPRVVVVAGTEVQRNGIANMLENNGLIVEGKLGHEEESIIKMDKKTADVLLVDMCDCEEYDLNLDALDSLLDKCQLPILFNDSSVESTSVNWGRKMTGKIYETLGVDVPKELTKQFHQHVQKVTIKNRSALTEKNHGKQIQSIGKVLLELEKVSQQELDKALQLQIESDKKLGDILVEMEIISDRDLAITIARQLSIPLVRPVDYPEEKLCENLISERFLHEYQMIPIKDRADGLAVAMLDPFDEYAKEAIRIAVDKTVIPCVAVMSEFNEVNERIYGSSKSLMSEILDDIGMDDESSDEDDVEHLKDMASEAPIIRLVSLIIHDAIKVRASDIHIEPFENELKVRYRIDGILQDVESPPAQSCAAVISRVKIMAKLDIAERRLPQDGRIKLKVEDRDVDLRVSTIPTMHGESVVMRLLINDNIIQDFDSLGLIGKPVDEFLHCLAQPHGVLLVTGPTGSGKTTTLYTALGRLNTPGRKILTVEDPVEYQLEGINQIQVKSAIGLTFAGALRSIVRQDPDVIMIGEMRDLETAQIAIQSALTGHMVLSTLHTNDAPSSITRLLDMGIEDYLITSSVIGILAQRLVRKLCGECKQSFIASDDLINELKLRKYQPEGEVQLTKPVGCEKCNQSGYAGRVSIVQMMIMTEAIRKLVMQHADASVIQAETEKQGMATMLEDGIHKALKGMTTIEEIIRVTQDSH